MKQKNIFIKEENDMRLIINIIDEKEEKSDTEVTINCNLSDSIRIFDDSCLSWTKDPEYNLMYLRTQERYANEMLNHKGYLFLNDIYKMMGMDLSKAGQVVGWIKGEGKFVDFGLNSKINERFRDGEINTATLEFNVYGEILSKL